MPRKSSHAPAHKISRARKALGRSNGGTKPARAKHHVKHHKASPRGRAATVDPTKVQALKSRGFSASKIATKLKISRSSVYRYARAA
jgi:DNA invertase Pin-like site-specific DNA recombinase